MKPVLFVHALLAFIVGTLNFSGVSAGAGPTQLRFAVPPANTTVGAVLSDIVVQITDKDGNPLSHPTVTVTLAMNKGSGLTGDTNAITDGSGRATFRGLRILVTGSGDTLIATAPGSRSVTSPAFNVGKGSAAVAVAASANPCTYGQSVNLTASMSAGGTPSGTVTFKDGAATLGSVPLTSAGTATWTVNRMVVGATNHVISVIYSGDANYSGSTGTMTLTVGKCALAVAGITAADKVYDGTTTAAVDCSGAQLPVLLGDAVTLNAMGATGNFADKNAGAGKTVLVTGLTISGADAANYSLAGTISSTASIMPAELTVSAADASRSYGVANPALTPAFSGLVNGESLVVSGVSGAPSMACAAGADSAVGAYPIAVSVGTLAAVNYRFTPVDGTLTVVPAGTTTSLSTGSNPAFLGGDVALSASVHSPTNSLAAPAGLVQFYWNGTNGLGSAALSNSAAAITVPASRLGRGNFPVTAKFLDPAGNFISSTDSLVIRIMVAQAGKLELVPPFRGGQVNAQVIGQEGQTYVIQASTDLVNWVSISTNIAGADGSVSFTDSTAGNFGRRFYRTYTP